MPQGQDDSQDFCVCTFPKKTDQDTNRNTYLQLLIELKICPLSLQLVKTETISSLNKKLTGNLQIQRQAQNDRMPLVLDKQKIKNVEIYFFCRHSEYELKDFQGF